MRILVSELRAPARFHVSHCTPPTTSPPSRPPSPPPGGAGVAKRLDPTKPRQPVHVLSFGNDEDALPKSLPVRPPPNRPLPKATRPHPTAPPAPRPHQADPTPGDSVELASESHQVPSPAPKPAQDPLLTSVDVVGSLPTAGQPSSALHPTSSPLTQPWPDRKHRIVTRHQQRRALEAMEVDEFEALERQVMNQIGSSAKSKGGFPAKNPTHRPGPNMFADDDVDQDVDHHHQDDDEEEQEAATERAPRGTPRGNPYHHPSLKDRRPERREEEHARRGDDAPWSSLGPASPAKTDAHARPAPLISSPPRHLPTAATSYRDNDDDDDDDDDHHHHHHRHHRYHEVDEEEVRDPAVATSASRRHDAHPTRQRLRDRSLDQSLDRDGRDRSLSMVDPRAPLQDLDGSYAARYVQTTSRGRQRPSTAPSTGAGSQATSRASSRERGAPSEQSVRSTRRSEALDRLRSRSTARSRPAPDRRLPSLTRPATQQHAPPPALVYDDDACHDDQESHPWDDERTRHHHDHHRGDRQDGLDFYENNEYGAGEEDSESLQVTNPFVRGMFEASRTAGGARRTDRRPGRQDSRRTWTWTWTWTWT